MELMFFQRPTPRPLSKSFTFQVPVLFPAHPRLGSRFLDRFNAVPVADRQELHRFNARLISLLGLINCSQL